MMVGQRAGSHDGRAHGEPRPKPRGDVPGRRKANSRGFERGERGAALVTVLLFMTLTFILITSMLTVAGNEVVISSLQRDGIRAVEFAQAGIDEAIKRMEQGRPLYMGGTPWPTSLDSSTTVLVTRRVVGVSAAYVEIAATSTVGRSTRRISRLVLQRTLTFPPNITFAEKVTEQGSADITQGDAYARTFIQYKKYPSCGSYSYTGWRMSKTSGGGTAAKCAGSGNDDIEIDPTKCYTHAQCVTNYPTNTHVVNWYPGTRRAENTASAAGADIQAQTLKCEAGGGGSLPSTTITGVLAEEPCNTDADCAAAGKNIAHPLYGFDSDDPDGAGPIAPQAVTTALPCGLPYTLIPQTFVGEDNVTRTRLFKSTVFEQWFENYWQFNESTMQYTRKTSLATYPQFGAIPPFPDFSSVEGSYDRRVTCTGSCVVNSGDFGCKWPEMSGDANCSIAPANSDRPIIVWLDGDSSTTWDINANLLGHGTIVVDGNLRINGTFEYWGTVIVNGTAENTMGGGNPKIHGGLVAQSTLSLNGNIEVDGGSSYTNVPVGRSVVTGKAWWER